MDEDRVVEGRVTIGDRGEHVRGDERVMGIGDDVRGG
jgi:hypothetical protein